MVCRACQTNKLLNTNASVNTNISTISTKSLQTCGTQETQILNSISGKTINNNKLLDPSVPPSGKDWYKATDSSGAYIGALYQDSTDTTYDYGYAILYNSTGQIDCTSNPVINCTCIIILIADKAGNSISGTLPDNVITESLASLPITHIPSGCGTGIWNGCTLDIPNKYLIIAAAGGIGILVWALSSKEIVE